MTHSSSNGGGCFSGIGRLLLCRGSLQTHPSSDDQIITQPAAVDQFDHVKKDSMVNLKVEETPVLTRTPGVVARLMGLDSLPNSNWVPKAGTAPDLVTRSRSVNFMDYLLEFDLAQTQQQHRRVRTSVSFREVPTLFNRENQNDFLLLYLDDIENCKKNGSNLRKSQVGLEDIKQKREEKNKTMTKKEKKNRRTHKLKDEPRKLSNDNQYSRFGSRKGADASSGFVSPSKKERVTVKKAKNPLKPINQKEVQVESKLMKKIKNQYTNKQVGYSDLSSQDSNPVSILDLDECPIHYQTPLSEKKSSPRTNNSNNISVARDYIQVVKKLRRLTEEDIKEAKLVAENVLEFETFEEICLYLGQEILDTLVKQVVEELVEFH